MLGSLLQWRWQWASIEHFVFLFCYRFLHFLRLLRNGWKGWFQCGRPDKLRGRDGRGQRGRGLCNAQLLLKSSQEAQISPFYKRISLIAKGDDESADIGDDPELEAIKVHIFDALKTQLKIQAWIHLENTDGAKTDHSIESLSPSRRVWGSVQKRGRKCNFTNMERKSEKSLW